MIGDADFRRYTQIIKILATEVAEKDKNKKYCRKKRKDGEIEKS